MREEPAPRRALHAPRRVLAWQRLAKAERGPVTGTAGRGAPSGRGAPALHGSAAHATAAGGGRACGGLGAGAPAAGGVDRAGRRGRGRGPGAHLVRMAVRAGSPKPLSSHTPGVKGQRCTHCGCPGPQLSERPGPGCPRGPRPLPLPDTGLGATLRAIPTERFHRETWRRWTCFEVTAGGGGQTVNVAACRRDVAGAWRLEPEGALLAGGRGGGGTGLRGGHSLGPGSHLKRRQRGAVCPHTRCASASHGDTALGHTQSRHQTARAPLTENGPVSQSH